MVIGDVVKKRDEFAWFEKKEFFGKSILVTRDEVQGDIFAKEIEKKRRICCTSAVFKNSGQNGKF